MNYYARIYIGEPEILYIFVLNYTVPDKLSAFYGYSIFEKFNYYIGFIILGNPKFGYKHYINVEKTNIPQNFSRLLTKEEIVIGKLTDWKNIK